MKREADGPILSAVFVDYDNIYLSLRRKNEEAARRFSKDASQWLRDIEAGRLITPTNSPTAQIPRRMVMNRCYGNPVPRRNAGDNSTDMNSFPFVRHHFLRAGFEIVDCPPLTAQLKNSSDIRMVMDIRDLLTHDTYYDEFIILSGDADFTPVLHRLRAHARRTVIFANEHTAAPYTAICDGEVREIDLMQLLGGGAVGDEATGRPSLTRGQSLEQVRGEIIADVVQNVRRTNAPMPLETLAERAMRTLGHDRTIGTDWAGHGSFRELLLKGLPADLRLSDDPPYLVMPAQSATPAPVGQLTRAQPASRDVVPRESAGRDVTSREGTEHAQLPALRTRAQPSAPAAAPAQPQATRPAAPPQQSLPAAPREPFRSRPATLEQQRSPARPDALAERMPSTADRAPQQAPTQPPAQPAPDRPSAEALALQQSIARIHDACQAPPLSPPEYRALFEAMASEIGENGLQGAQTLANVQLRASEAGLSLQRDDIRFVLDVVSEADPWFEQGSSPTLFAGRFRNFVVARCRTQGLALSAEELDLIEAWFAGGPPPGPGSGSRVPRPGPNPGEVVQAPRPQTDHRNGQWWASDQQQSAPSQYAQARGQLGSEPPALVGHAAGEDEFPRIVTTRRR